MNISEIGNSKAMKFLINIIKTVWAALYKFFGTVLPKFIKDTYSISSTKRSRITGIIFAVVLLVVVAFSSKQFTSLAFKQKWILFAVALMGPFIIGSAIAFKITVKNHIVNVIQHFAMIFLMPFLYITMTEALNKIFIYDMTYLGFFANYLLVLLFEFVFFAATGSFRVAFLVPNIILYGFALAHCYVMEFRGTPFIPMDFFSITTAAGVANTYKYSLMYTVILGSLLFILIMVLAIKTLTPKLNLITKVISRTFMGTFFAVLMILFYFTSVFADAGVKPDFWNQARGYKNYGFAFSFFCNTKYLHMSEPSGYDANAVGDYVASTVDDDEEDEQNNIVVNPNAPNIICIMNESLADLSVLGEFTTNEDYMPFMRSLTENTVKGNLLVPVIGAGTSNTEFEFITGHSTAFLPSGSNAYMLYINNPVASLVSTLEGQGYSSFAFHPYYKKGWNRVSVYNYLGFDKKSFLEEIMDISLMGEYDRNGSNPDYLQQLIDQRYPERQNMLIRQYVSDSYDYQVIIDDFEQRDKSIPYFVFNVTMQNHGGYTSSALNFNESIYVTSSSKVYNKTNKYLSLVKASDDAFAGLVNYFSNIDDPTIICMFGDHQPSIETQFVAEVMGVKDLSNLTIEQEQARHTTPFIIWANYDIEEEYIERLSCNYLSSYLLDIADVKLTEYNKYLLKLSEQLPVIDTTGYIDAQGNYYKWGDRSDYVEILSEYEKIQYNNIFDAEHKNKEIFYLEGYVHEVTEDPEEARTTDNVGAAQ